MASTATPQLSSITLASLSKKERVVLGLWCPGVFKCGSRNLGAHLAFSECHRGCFETSGCRLANRLSSLRLHSSHRGCLSPSRGPFCPCHRFWARRRHCHARRPVLQASSSSTNDCRDRCSLCGCPETASLLYGCFLLKTSLMMSPDSSVMSTDLALRVIVITRLQLLFSFQSESLDHVPAARPDPATCTVVF